MPRQRRTIGILCNSHVYIGTTIARYEQHLLGGIFSAAMANNCDVLAACGIAAAAEPWQRHTAWPFALPGASFVPIGPWNTDGLIVVPPFSAYQHEQLEQINQRHPLVVTSPDPQFASVGPDNAGGIAQLVAHLVAHGHRRIAYLASEPEPAGDGAERYDAFYAAMQDHGLEVRPEWIGYGMHNRNYAYTATLALLHNAPGWTALMTSNDESAIGALWALDDAGVRVPQQVALAGFDDGLYARIQQPPLTTVHHPTFELGQLAVELLLDQIETRSAAETRRIAAKMVIRESCGCSGSGQQPVLATADLQREQVQWLIDQAAQADQLGALTSQLLGATTPQQICATLDEHLPKVGIQQAAVGLFSPASAPWQWYTLADQPDALPLSCQQFPHPGLLDPERPGQLVVLPVHIEEQQVGFAALATDDLENCGLIVRHIGVALRNCQLYQAAEAGRRAAEEARRMQSRFLSTVSHELRHPLNQIVGLSALLHRELHESLPPAAARDLDQITAHAQHLGQMIGDVLDLASSEAGQLRLNLQPLDLRELVASVAPVGAQMASEHGLGWQAHLPETPLWVYGDSTRLRQVLLNLLGNAAKFTGQGSITLLLAEASGSASLIVEDTGPGIPAEEQTRIFQEFHRAGRAAGLGLGLAISRQLVEGQGGTIAVESPLSTRGGTRFLVALPLLAAPPNTTQASIAPPIILVVEDDPDTRALHQRVIEEHMPAHIHSVGDGREALARMATAPPDLLLLDLMLPDMDGFALLAAMRKQEATRDTPVIVLTGQVLGETDLARLGPNVAAVLQKGLFRHQEIAAHIESALNGQRRIGSAAQQVVRQAIGFIHRHYQQPLTREQMAAHIGITGDHLTACFRQALGVTPIAYLGRYRISRGRALLETSQRSISEIALDVGFTDLPSFSRAFHREHGCSPQAYRRSLRAADPRR